MKVILRGVAQIELVDLGIEYDNILLEHIEIFLAIVQSLESWITQLHLEIKRKTLFVSK